MEHWGVLNYTTYVLGCIAIVLLPGPNSLYVLSTAAQHGHKAGWLGAMGIFLGDAILMTATAAGAVSVLAAYPLLFKAVQYAGAAYLTYIGIKLFIAAYKTWKQRFDTVDLAPLLTTEPVSKGSYFKRSLLISLLNPKALLFFFSFFVQFVDPQYQGNPVVPFLILALTVQICSFLYLASLIYAGVYLAQAFKRRKRLSAVSSGSVGALFMAFAAKLAMTSAT